MFWVYVTHIVLTIDHTVLILHMVSNLYSIKYEAVHFKSDCQENKDETSVPFSNGVTIGMMLVDGEAIV